MAETEKLPSAQSASSGLPALREADPKDIIARYLSDESTSEIAKAYGVTRQALGKYLLEAAESEWKAAQVARAIARKEQAEDDVEAARSALTGNPDREAREQSLARVRVAEAQLKSAQWDLERVCKRIYGTDSPQPTSAVQININLRRASSTVSHASARGLVDVQAQQYDSRAPQHEDVIDVVPVDSSEKT